MSPLFSDALLRAQSDDRLATLARQGHERAFGVLVERYRPSLIRVAARMVGPDRAEDVSQQALLGAWRALQAGTQVRHVRAWLFQALRHTMYTDHTRTREHVELAETVADPRSTSTLAEQNIELTATLAALAHLPEQQRIAISQTELAGRSRREIARDLGLSEGAVRQLVHRARVTLRQAVTVITPLQLAELAARPRPSSRLSEHVASLTAASSAGIGATAATGAGSGAALLATGSAIKGAAAVLALAGAIGGALAIKAPHRERSARPAALNVATAQRTGTVAQAHEAGIEGARRPSPDRSRPPARGGGSGAHHRRSRAAVLSTEPAPPQAPVASPRPSGDSREHRTESRPEADRVASNGDHSRSGSGEGAVSGQSTDTTSVTTSAQQGDQAGSAEGAPTQETTITTTATDS
ncbi:MAG: RNA polymerase sigma factor [Solirubrobacteraceae bacterium]